MNFIHTVNLIIYFY